MASTGQFLSPTSKNILQQSNGNVPAAYAGPEKEGPRRKRPLPSETENRLEEPRTVASKLRRVRLEFSSQKLGLSNGGEYPLRVGYCRFSSDETGEEDEDEEEFAGEERGRRRRGEEAEEDRGTQRRPPQRPIIPNYVTKSDNGQYRKRRKASADALDLSSQKEDGGGGGRSQAAISIAKRNARERNRVKLVNQGFATLRSRIPDYISEIYTEEKRKRKVSKVETLRMAVGYIRHLTEMLELRATAPGDWFPATADESSADAAFYDYDVDGEADGTGKATSPLPEEDAGEAAEEEEEEDDGLLPCEEDAKGDLVLGVGCCYDLVGQDQPKKTPPLPSITESFPKKSLRAFYDPPAFLSGSSAFHV